MRTTQKLIMTICKCNEYIMYEILNRSNATDDFVIRMIESHYAMVPSPHFLKEFTIHPDELKIKKWSISLLIELYLPGGHVPT